MTQASPLLLLLLSLAGCTAESTGNCVATVPSTRLYEILCGQNEGPQGICLAEVDNGF